MTGWRPDNCISSTLSLPISFISWRLRRDPSLHCVDHLTLCGSPRWKPSFQLQASTLQLTPQVTVLACRPFVSAPSRRCHHVGHVGLARPQSMGKKRKQRGSTANREDVLNALDWEKVEGPSHAGFEMEEAGFAELETIDGASVDVIETSPGVFEIRPKSNSEADTGAAANSSVSQSTDAAPSSSDLDASESLNPGTRRQQGSKGNSAQKKALTEKQKRLKAQVEERRERKRRKQQEKKAARNAEKERASVKGTSAVAPNPPPTHKTKKRQRTAFKQEDVTLEALIKFERALRKKLKSIGELKKRVKADGIVPNAEQTIKLQREDELEEKLATCTKQLASFKDAESSLKHDAEHPSDGWGEFGLDRQISDNLRKLNFHMPTKIQQVCMPTILHRRRDVIAAAETGSGKTLAFGLPLVQMIQWLSVKQRRQVPLSALILTPTRELALQVKSHIDAVAAGTSVTTAAIVGGISEEKQNRLLSKQPDIVVGTCGRLWIHISQGHPHLSQLHRLRFLVLDEADRMLDRGHYAELNQIVLQITRSRVDVEVDDDDVLDADEELDVAVSNFKRGDSEALRVLEKCEKDTKRQTLLFSATMTLGAESRRTTKVRRKRGKEKKATKSTTNMLRELMSKVGCRGRPEIIDLTTNTNDEEGLSSHSAPNSSSVGSSTTLPDGLELARIECTQEDKDLYVYYFCKLHPGRTIIFANSIAVVRKLSTLLRLLNLPVHALHAQMQQRQRLKNMDRFRSAENCVLVASDVAARGLDVPNVDHVIHYNIARTPEIFIHRSGRTARANTQGLSLSLVTPMVEERRAFHNVCKTLGMNQDDIRRFEVNIAYMPHVRTRVKLAKRLRRETTRNGQQKADDLWFKQQAEAADIMLDSDEEEIDGVFRRKESTLEDRLRAELNALISKPLLGRGIGGSRKYAHGR